jgi:hypothetical protein
MEDASDYDLALVLFVLLLIPIFGFFGIIIDIR